jgi:hypothetical protein
MEAITILPNLNHAITIRVTAPLPLEFLQCLNDAIVYTWPTYGPTFRCIGRLHISTRTILPPHETIRTPDSFAPSQAQSPIPNPRTPACPLSSPATARQRRRRRDGEATTLKVFFTRSRALTSWAAHCPPRPRWVTSQDRMPQVQHKGDKMQEQEQWCVLQMPNHYAVSLVGLSLIWGL